MDDDEEKDYFDLDESVDPSEINQKQHQKK